MKLGLPAYHELYPKLLNSSINVQKILAMEIQLRTSHTGLQAGNLDDNKSPQHFTTSLIESKDSGSHSTMSRLV